MTLGNKTRWRLKACPRCGGDFYTEKQEEAWYEHCLQCGHQQEMLIIPSRPSSKRKKSKIKYKVPVGVN